MFWRNNSPPLKRSLGRRTVSSWQEHFRISYTGTTIEFEKANASAVQIDHVLSAALSRSLPLSAGYCVDDMAAECCGGLVMRQRVTGVAVAAAAFRCRCVWLLGPSA